MRSAPVTSLRARRRPDLEKGKIEPEIAGGGRQEEEGETGRSERERVGHVSVARFGCYTERRSRERRNVGRGGEMDGGKGMGEKLNGRGRGKGRGRRVWSWRAGGVDDTFHISTSTGTAAEQRIEVGQRAEAKPKERMSELKDVI